MLRRRLDNKNRRPPHRRTMKKSRVRRRRRPLHPAGAHRPRPLRMMRTTTRPPPPRLNQARASVQPRPTSPTTASRRESRNRPSMPQKSLILRSSSNRSLSCLPSSLYNQTAACPIIRIIIIITIIITKTSPTKHSQTRM